MNKITTEKLYTCMQTWIKAHKAYHAENSTEEFRSQMAMRADQAQNNNDWEFFNNLLIEAADMNQKVQDFRLKVFGDMNMLSARHYDALDLDSRAKLMTLTSSVWYVADMRAIRDLYVQASEIIRTKTSERLTKYILDNYRLKEQA